MQGLDSSGGLAALVARPPRQIPDIVDPWRGGATPDLPRGLELIALADGAPADAPVVRPAVAAGEQRGTTILAKMLEARAAIVAGLRVDLRRRARHADLFFGADHRDPVRRARQVLAIGAVADRYFRGIDVGPIGHPPAMALPVDFHPLQLRLSNGGPSAQTKNGARGRRFIMLQWIRSGSVGREATGRFVRGVGLDRHLGVLFP